jgi:hypothetical protein
MTIAPFLPGLTFLFAAWIWPVIARLIPVAAAAPLARRAPWLASAAPWIRSALIPYLAIILGWISVRDFGLIGQTAVEWIAGAIFALGLGILLGRWLASRSMSPAAEGMVQDETRWILYRAALWPLAGSLWMAVLGGLVLMLGEFFLGHLLRRERPSPAVTAPYLMRAFCSSFLFFVAHNYFLSIFMYCILFLALHPPFPAPWRKRPAA